MSSGERKVVITGTGILSPVGYSANEIMVSVFEGKSKFQKIDSAVESISAAKYAGVCEQLDMSVLPDKKVKKTITRKDLIGLIASIKAAKNAEINSQKINPERFGMYVGAGSTHISDLAPYFPLIKESLKSGNFDSHYFGANLMGSVNPMVMLQTLMNNTLCYASVALDIRGVNANFMDFQASGLRAVGEAYLSIMADRADIVLAGGVSSTPEPFHAEDGIKMGYLARTDDKDIDLDKTIRPFDAERCGTILSEGASFVILEEEEHALKRGAKILARIKSYSTGCDGNFAFLSHEKSPGLLSALNSLYKLANIEKQKTAFIIAHANGSTFGDSSEANVYKTFFGEQISQIPITSPKSVLGEMSEASGVSALILASQAFSDRRIPGTKNFLQADTATKNLSISSNSQNFSGNHAIVTARSFSGISCCMMVERV